MKQKKYTNSKYKPHQWLALLLSVVLLYTLLPLQWAHSYTHTEETCVETDTCQDVDPCHITLYHQHIPVEHCNHNSHIDAQHEVCNICYLLSHHPQQQYTQPAPYTFGTMIAVNLITTNFSKNYTPVFSPTQTNKGPPLV